MHFLTNLSVGQIIALIVVAGAVWLLIKGMKTPPRGSAQDYQQNQQGGGLFGNRMNNGQMGNQMNGQMGNQMGGPMNNQMNRPPMGNQMGNQMGNNYGQTNNQPGGYNQQNNYNQQGGYNQQNNNQYR